MKMFPLIVVALSCTIPAWATERHMMQPRVPADKLAEARWRVRRRPSRRGRRSTTARALASTVTGKTGTVMGRWRLNWTHRLAISNTRDSGVIARKAKFFG